MTEHRDRSRVRHLEAGTSKLRSITLVKDGKPEGKSDEPKAQPKADELKPEPKAESAKAAADEERPVPPEPDPPLPDPALGLKVTRIAVGRPPICVLPMPRPPIHPLPRSSSESTRNLRVIKP